jgi:hypothetical protein
MIYAGHRAGGLILKQFSRICKQKKGVQNQALLTAGQKSDMIIDDE